MTNRSKSVRDYLFDKSSEGVSRFLHMFQRTPSAYGTIQAKMNTWTNDETAGTTYDANAGTTAQAQVPTMAFSYQTANTYAFFIFTVPTDWNQDKAELYLIIKWYSASDHANTHLAKWSGKARRIPAGLADTSGYEDVNNVVLDGAGTAFTAVNGYCDDTVNEIVTSVIPIHAGASAVTNALEPIDSVVIMLYNDQANDSLTSTPLVCDACFVYSK